MLRYKNGSYNVKGQLVEIEFEQTHNGAFGSIKDAAVVEKLKRIYDQKECCFTATDRIYTKAFGK